MITPNGGSEADFRNLIERLFLRPRYGQETRLLVGELPPDWDIPLPSSAVVVGSLVTFEFQAQVVLDVPGDSEQAVAAVAQGLWAEGWRTSRGAPGIRSGGFILSGLGRPQSGVLLCDDQRRRHLRVSAENDEDGRADVRLHLNNNPDNFGICEFDGQMFRDSTSIFPQLRPPPGISQWGGGGGSSGSSSHSHATLRGDLPVEDIEGHYRDQLITAGWSLSGHAAAGRWAWSVWDFLDERRDQWTGLLTVAEPADQKNIRHATIVAASARDRGGLSGMATWLL